MTGFATLYPGSEESDASARRLVHQAPPGPFAWTENFEDRITAEGRVIHQATGQHTGGRAKGVRNLKHATKSIEIALGHRRDFGVIPVVRQ
jgi:hypothetical protein